MIIIYNTDPNFWLGLSDLLFGTCQKRGEARDDFVWDQLTEDQLSDLEQEVRRLIRDGYAWQDLYTQCVLGNILLAYRSRRPADPMFCDTGGGRNGDLTEQLSQDALRLLQQYFEDYYGNDLVDADDLGTPSREFMVPNYSAESDRSYEQKKDELVNIHKYQKSRKRMWDDQDSYEGCVFIGLSIKLIYATASFFMNIYNHVIIIKCKI